MHKNALVQLVTSSLSMAQLAMSLRGLGETTIRDVSYKIRERYFSIRFPPEEGHPQTPAFAESVIRNF